ncbi:hypothetical protein H6G33_36325 [Calothrix sp. FACHB-1219]|uniref:plasmid replication protein, CyRepA1 family n=1 Tax=unclassified Calothrix TaxID=2619626 RepID=UPI0016832E9C|nr:MULTISPECIES: plasmid replication protein, CyRepA1 family [unclassified Calothrix]MBD2207779.1 hypothetical protein [Calothrix sp. FACHB-168]MBD2222399.1 hypothetical protein [Calothrix sp. FACHB-1219]
MFNRTLEKFDIRNFIDQLTPKKGKNRYICPVCEGTLTINPSNGQYHCWGEECSTKVIRESIRPLDEALAEAGIEKKGFAPKTHNQKPKAVISPAAIPAGDIQLGTLPYAVKQEVRVKVKKSIEIKYPYSPSQWVKRIERADGSKLTLPFHLDANGKEVNAKGDKPWQPYRFDEITQHGFGQWVLGVEGEKCADVARSIFGFLTTTFQGGSWSEALLVEYFQLFKDIDIAGIVYWPDHDKPGYSKLEKCRTAAAKVGLPFIAIDPTRLWADCLDGGDIADWVKAGLGDVDALHEEINLAADVARGGKTPTDWKDKVLAVQKQLHTLTYKADYVCNPYEKYLPDNLVDIIPHKGIVLIKAPKGAGKSVTIKRIKDKLCGGYYQEVYHPYQLSITGDNKPEVERVYQERTGVRFISITARIALGRAQAIEWEITWIEDGDLTESEQFNYEGEVIKTATFLETADGIGLCWDSLAKLFDRDWSNTVVVIDEIELGLSHVATSSTCKDRRPTILYTLETKIRECLDNNGLVIGADADLTNISYDYLTAIAPGHKPFIVKHNYIRPDSDKWDIDFYTGKRDVVLSLIEIWLSDQNCEPIAVALDNQSEAESLASHLVKKYPYLASSFNGLIRIDAQTTQTDSGKDFVKRPNEKIQEYQPKILIYTPSLGVGCSLDVPYFKYVFGLFFGNLEPSQARQMLARVRQPVPRIVWCADRGKTSNTDDCNAFLPDAIKNQMFSYNKTTTEIIDIALHLAREQAESNNDVDILPKLIEQLTKMMGKGGTWNNPHVDLFCKLKARRNFALSQLAVQLRQELIDEGHNLKDIAAEEKTNAGDSVREEKTEIKLNRATMTANAVDIPLEVAKEISRKPNPTNEEQHQANKAFLKDELPGLELTPEFLFKGVYQDNRFWLNAVKLFWMSQNVDATQEADRKHWKYKLKQFCEGVPYLPDLRTFSTKVEAINKIGIFDAIPLDDFESEYHGNDSTLKEWFKKSVLPQKKLLKTAFNITVNKDTEIITFINRILGKVGIRLKQHRKTNNTKYYKLDSEMILDQDRANVLASLDLKRELQLKKEAEQSTLNTQHSTVNAQQSMLNSQQPMVNGQQFTEADWLREECVQDLAVLLNHCEDAEMLADLRAIVPYSSALRVASRRLPESKKQLIRQWLAA